MEIKNLEKGDCSYDLTNDIFLLKSKNRDYGTSVEFENLILDLDIEGNARGLRLFNASKVLRLPRKIVKSIKKFRLNICVEENIVSVRLHISYGLGKYLGQDFVREATEIKLKDSELSCVIL